MNKFFILIISIFIICGLIFLAEFAEVPNPEGKAKDIFMNPH